MTSNGAQQLMGVAHEKVACESARRLSEVGCSIAWVGMVLAQRHRRTTACKVTAASTRSYLAPAFSRA